MEAEFDKFSLNGLMSLIVPGTLFSLSICWITFTHFAIDLQFINNAEVLWLFLLIITAFFIGTIINTIAQWAELRIYKLQKFRPHLFALQDKKHWIDDLDQLFFSHTGIHIYDCNKEGEFKIDEQGEKKIEKYNLTQFEKFGNFYLAKYEMQDAVRLLKEKYLLYRNTGIALFLLAIIIFVYLFFLKADTITQVLYCTYQSMKYVAICAIVLSICFTPSVKKMRVTYLELLYRYSRYQYLFEKQNNK